MKRTERIRLCLPPVVLYGIDIGVTLACQEPAYWAGASCHVYEANPLAYQLLLLPPGVFLVAAVLWPLVYVGLICWVRPPLALVASFLITILHAIGAVTWLVRGGVAGWCCAVVVLVLAQRLLAWAWSETAEELATND